jgi:monoamine oxidase
MYGERARTPREVHIMDWADDPLVATSQDHIPPAGHPDYRPLKESLGAWEGRLILSGSELASEEGGYIEGALASAEDTLRLLVASE